jgi:ParB-like chromosome segregation protein Spo0J
MATNLAGQKGQDWRRGDMYSVDPKKVMVRNDLRGRRYPPTDLDIIRRAVSFYRYGQIQPCEVRLMTHNGVSNVPYLNSGFTRCAAARLLRDGFTVPDDFEEEAITEGMAAKIAPVKPGDFVQVADFMLQCRAVKCNDDEALIRNIVENNERNDTTWIDDAYNQERLRRDCGMSNADIARLYGYGNGGQSKVSRLSRLLELPEWLQERIHYGLVPVSAALELLDSGRPVEEWEALLSDATNDHGKVVATKLVDTVRDQQLADFQNADEAEAAAANGTCPITSGQVTAAEVKVKPRTMTHLRKLVESVCTREWENVDDATIVLFQKIKLWMTGRCKDETLLTAFQAHLEAGVAAESEPEEVTDEEAVEAMALLKEQIAETEPEPEPEPEEVTDEEVTDEEVAETEPEEVTDEQVAETEPEEATDEQVAETEAGMIEEPAEAA